MGVHGLWRLIEPSGKPVPLETLENKVLAVDISIWLHQAVKGFQDSKGAPVPNAHLLGIYHRVCKLLYFKIKPVFVFDGGVPALKKQTIAKRNQSKSRNLSEAEKLQKQLLSTLLKHSAISKVLSEKTKASLTLPHKKTSKHENMYALPSPELDSTISSSEDDMESSTDTTDSSPTKHWDLHTIDMSSTHFRSLPVDVRHEILTDLKETRKQNSWGRLHELPKQSNDFASYQMKRLLKRQAVQSALEEAEKEMGGHSLSLAELESLLKDHGVVTTSDIGKRIASDENTRYLYIKDVKQALETARKEQLKLDAIQEESSSGNDSTVETKSKNKADLEFEEDIEKAIALSLQEEPSTSKTEISTEVVSSSTNSGNKSFSFLENFESDVSDEIEETAVEKKMSSARSYMIEYSGLTPNEISKILNEKKCSRLKNKKLLKKVSKDTIEIMSDSDESSECLVTSSENEKNPTLQNIAENNGTNVKAVETIRIDNKSDDTRVDSLENVIKNSTDDVEILSDSDTSADFEEVSDETEQKETNSMEIVIDPNQQPEDDLFGDIFDKEAEKIEDTEEFDKPLPKLREIITEKSTETEIEVKQAKESETPIADQNEVKSISIETDDKNEKYIEKVSNDELSKQEKIIDERNTKEVQSDKSSRSESGKPINREDGMEINDIQKKIEPEFKKIGIEDMKKLKHDLQKEKIDIMVEKSTKERMASNITDQMYQEAQELLELFGVPYIIAPMEAEAQCAFLEIIELTDGTITDDSDIWLFGGRTVYKHFFNPSKYVMEFKSENIKHNFKLTREQMILLALLVGSDYTIGLQGVGPVTALEILAAFPPSGSKEFSLSHSELLTGLKEFRSWFNKGKSGGPGRSTLKSKLKNVSFTDNFPSLQVVQAYMEPTVETSKEKFSWSKPDFVGLTDFAKQKFGWAPKKIEEILKPVIKRVQETQSQKSIKDYFKTVFKADTTDAQNQMSKRVKTALERIGKTPEELIAEEMEELAKEKQKKSRSKRTIDKDKKKTESKGNPKRARKKKEDIAANVEASVEDTDEKTLDKPKIPRPKRTGVTTETKIGSCDKRDEPIQKKIRGRNKKSNKNDLETVTVAPAQSSEKSKDVDENVEELKKYQDIALELKQRRRRRNELSKIDKILVQNKNKPPPKKPTEIIPDVLQEDEEIQLLQATTSRSLKRVEEIDEEVKKELALETKKKCFQPNVHKKEVIHQKLRDKSDLLKNKLKAIEIFRKSKKGPGFVPKRGKKKMAPKEDAELSENSDE